MGRWLLCMIVLLTGSVAGAAGISEGAPLPAVTVSDAGELVKNGDELDFEPWSSTSLRGRMRIVQHIAGRSSARKLTEPLTDAITAAVLPEDRYQTTTIIDQSDALFGTGGVVAGRAESSKRQFPWSSVVLDATGAVREAWGLEEKTASVFVLDSDGVVLKAHEGKLSEADIEAILTLVQDGL